MYQLGASYLFASSSIRQNWYHQNMAHGNTLGLFERHLFQADLALSIGLSVWQAGAHDNF